MLCELRMISHFKPYDDTTTQTSLTCMHILLHTHTCTYTYMHVHAHTLTYTMTTLRRPRLHTCTYSYIHTTRTSHRSKSFYTAQLIISHPKKFTTHQQAVSQFSHTCICIHFELCTHMCNISILLRHEHFIPREQITCALPAYIHSHTRTYMHAHM
jgi:hypothetical protein